MVVGKTGQRKVCFSYSNGEPISINVGYILYKQKLTSFTCKFAAAVNEKDGGHYKEGSVCLRVADEPSGPHSVWC